LIFKQRDVTRAARALRAAGFDLARIEINRDGLIVVVPGKPAEDVSGGSDLDKWMKAHARATEGN
jgi:hypothetical protein